MIKDKDVFSFFLHFSFPFFKAPVTDKHTPTEKRTVRTANSPWIDEGLRNCMVERGEAKGMANKSGCPVDWQTYCKKRNYETKQQRRRNCTTKTKSTFL